MSTKQQKQKPSEYDRALILGNRLHINCAIQSLNNALPNLRGIDDAGLAREVAKVRAALSALVNYNCSMVKRGVS